MSEHVVPVRIYFTIFAVLLGLTAVTVIVSGIDLGRMNTVVALAIAVTKAVLVILYFMHLRYSTRLTWLVMSSGFVWLGILILFTMTDVLTRGLATLTR
jgi:cytochrome c oxidase subunit 4